MSRHQVHFLHQTHGIYKIIQHYKGYIFIDKSFIRLHFTPFLTALFSIKTLGPYTLVILLWWNVGSYEAVPEGSPYEAVRMRIYGPPRILKNWLADSSVTWISHLIIHLTNYPCNIISTHKTDLKIVIEYSFCPDWIPDLWFATSWLTQALILMKVISKVAVLSHILYKSFCNGNI